MSDEELLTLIRTMEKEREEAHRAPSHILYYELVGRARIDEDTLRKQLNSLYAQNQIHVGSTLNDKYIHAK